MKLSKLQLLKLSRLITKLPYFPDRRAFNQFKNKHNNIDGIDLLWKHIKTDQLRVYRNEQNEVCVVDIKESELVDAIKMLNGLYGSGGEDLETLKTSQSLKGKAIFEYIQANYGNSESSIRSWIFQKKHDRNSSHKDFPVKKIGKEYFTTKQEIDTYFLNRK